MSRVALVLLLVLFAILVWLLLRRWRRHTASATALPPPGHTRPDGPVEMDNLDDRMIELERLLADGQITREEYDSRRRELMDSVEG